MKSDLDIKIGITGSHGFVGKHLLKRFKNPVRLGREGDTEGCDVVYDLATYGNLANHRDAVKIYHANLMRVIKMLSDFRGRFVYMSTSSVTLPVQTPYSLSKRAAERYILTKKATIIRPYTIIGVGEQEEHLIPKLIDSCLNGTEMPFVPEPVHDYINVEDVLDAMLFLKDGIYEIGTGRATTNQEVREIVEKVTGKKANVKLVKKMRDYDTKDWVAKNSWNCKWTLEKTIKEMVYAKKNT